MTAELLITLLFLVIVLIAILYVIDLGLQAGARQHGVHPHRLPRHQGLPGPRRDRPAGVPRGHLGLAGDPEAHRQPFARSGGAHLRQDPDRRGGGALRPRRPERRGSARRRAQPRRAHLRHREGPQPPRSQDRQRAAQLRGHQDPERAPREPRRLRQGGAGERGRELPTPTASRSKKSPSSPWSRAPRSSSTRTTCSTPRA